VDRWITASKLVDHLDELGAERGYPAVLRCDNGPKFIFEAMADWASTRTGFCYVPPGSPWFYGYAESFSAHLRDECLNIDSLYSLLHAGVVNGGWKSEYDHDRRQSSLGFVATADYARHYAYR